MTKGIPNKPRVYSSRISQADKINNIKNIYRNNPEISVGEIQNRLKGTPYGMRKQNLVKAAGQVRKEWIKETKNLIKNDKGFKQSTKERLIKNLNKQIKGKQYRKIADMRRGLYSKDGQAIHIPSN